MAKETVKACRIYSSRERESQEKRGRREAERILEEDRRGESRRIFPFRQWENPAC